MCGIGGLFSINHSGATVPVIERLARSMRHRGPDDEGYLLLDPLSGRVEMLRGDDSQLPTSAPSIRHIRDARSELYSLALAHRRLSILDVSTAGHQPMSSPDGRYHLVYNGEVYNFVELRDELETQGWGFRSSSDTEVVLAALAAWGADALPRFIGMFALAWIDLERKRMLLARDPFGIKPLHYCQTNTQFAFASEPRALLHLPGVSRRIDAQAAYTYLRHNVTDHNELTFFADIKQLPPAHVLEIDLARHEVHAPSRYWQPDQITQWQDAYPVAIERLRSEFQQSVRLHLRSDVPVAVMLSGGIDSSAVTMAARGAMGEGASLDAFSYIAPEPKANESRWIDMVAGAASARVHRIEPDTSTLVEDIERVIRDQQAPFGSLSIFAQHSVFKAVQAAGIKVILSGQGADELLGGYSPFVSARLASLVRSGRWWSAATYYGRGARRWPGRKRLTLGLAQQLMPSCIEQPIRKVIGKDAAPRWINKSWFLEREVSLASIRESRAGAAEPLKTALQDSLTRTNLPELLRYEDRNSMAHSVESRVPFLTAPLVSFLMSLPEHFIISDQCISKAIFRDAVRTLVPDAILDRQDKVAFSAPLRQWFPTLEPWLDETLHSDTAHRLSLLARDQVLSHWQLVQAGKKRPDNLLWRWVNLIRWAEQYEVTLE